MSKDVHECMNSFVPGVLLKTVHASEQAGACLSLLPGHLPTCSLPAGTRAVSSLCRSERR